jgi:FKBP12-rapamycin complex-associated protein
VAILWEELWHEAMEAASKYYFGSGNIQAMLDTLLPHHKALEEGTVTMREQAFYMQFHTDLHEAHVQLTE